MLKLLAVSEGKEALLVLGLEDTNLERLLQGKPIVLHSDSMAEIGIGGLEILLFHGKDIDAMKEKLVEVGIVPPEFVTGRH